MTSTRPAFSRFSLRRSRGGRNRDGTVSVGGLAWRLRPSGIQRRNHSHARATTRPVGFPHGLSLFVLFHVGRRKTFSNLRQGLDVNADENKRFLRRKLYLAPCGSLSCFACGRVRAPLRATSSPRTCALDHHVAGVGLPPRSAKQHAHALLAGSPLRVDGVMRGCEAPKGMLSMPPTERSAGRDAEAARHSHEARGDQACSRTASASPCAARLMSNALAFTMVGARTRSA